MASKIHVQCQCGFGGQIPASFAGRMVNCNKCGRQITIGETQGNPFQGMNAPGKPVVDFGNLDEEPEQTGVQAYPWLLSVVMIVVGWMMVSYAGLNAVIATINLASDKVTKFSFTAWFLVLHYPAGIFVAGLFMLAAAESVRLLRRLVKK